MPLSAIWRVDRTVNASGASPVAERIVVRWAHDPGTVRFFRSSANFLFTFQRDGKRNFLRFVPDAERRREAIEAEIDLVLWLGETGLPVVRPVPSLAGQLIETVPTDLGPFHAVAFAGLAGEQFESDGLSLDQLAAWGAALVELHAALKVYPRAEAVNRGSLRDHLAALRERLPADALGARRELDRIAAECAELPIDRDAYGLIHVDFELDNLVWRSQTIQILDFDKCAFGWYVADIAFALRDLFDAGTGVDDPRVWVFLAGYAASCPLDDALLTRLPLFARLARLIQFGRIAHSLDLNDSPDLPDWLDGLIARFQCRQAAYLAALGDGR